MELGFLKLWKFLEEERFNIEFLIVEVSVVFLLFKELDGVLKIELLMFGLVEDVKFSFLVLNMI